MSDIVRLVHRPAERHPEADMALRRLAIQLASQLPEDAAEALAVLDYTKSLVKMFLMPEGAMSA